MNFGAIKEELLAIESIEARAERKLNKLHKNLRKSLVILRIENAFKKL